MGKLTADSLFCSDLSLFICLLNLQVDFPSLQFDIIYKIPQAANGSVCHSMETLEKDSRDRLISILSKEGSHGCVVALRD